MTAVRYHSYGDSDVLAYEDADRPVAGAGQVAVKVAGTAFKQLAALAADGRAFVGTTFPDFDDARRGVRVMPVSVRSDSAQLAELLARVDAGDLKIDVARRCRLTDLAAVHDEAVAGRLAGKTVLTP